MSTRLTDGAGARHLAPGSFYGRVTQKRDDDGFILSDVRHAGPRKLPRHSHELAYFCLLLDGDYAERLGRRTIAYKPLTVSFHPPGTEHRDEIGNRGGHFFSVEVDGRPLDLLREYAPAPPSSFDLAGGELAWLAVRMYREFAAGDAASRLAIQGLLLEMLAAVARSSGAAESSEPAWLARATEFLHAEFRSNLTVAQIARRAGVHPCHLTRVFRQFKRQGVGEYVHRLRVQFACRRLADPEVGLADLALSAGFSDQSHFNRVFKQLTGMTPGAFRKQVTRPALTTRR
jgi:AraC family transcriptional regulator